MPTLTLRTIQFHPDTGAVALLLEHDLGSVFATTTEVALRARMPTPSENWGNDEALAEAQAWVDADARLCGKGYVVTLPPVETAATAPPATPPTDAPAGV